MIFTLRTISYSCGENDNLLFQHSYFSLVALCICFVLFLHEAVIKEIFLLTYLLSPPSLYNVFYIEPRMKGSANPTVVLVEQNMGVVYKPQTWFNSASLESGKYTSV